MRSRSVAFLREWDEGFKTYGPYATRMNDISYDSYHLFRAESRILTGSPLRQRGNLQPPTHATHQLRQSRCRSEDRPEV